MSDKNRGEGYEYYKIGGERARLWFEEQWRIWPNRAHPQRTTNLSYHHGAVNAYREVHGRDPGMSDQFKSNVAYLDRETNR